MAPLAVLVVRTSLTIALVLLTVSAPAAADPPEWISSGTFESAPGKILDMAFYSGALYAVGNFPTLEPDGRCSIARYDGVEWTPVTGLPDYSWGRIIPFRSSLMLQTSNHIYAWDGTTNYLLRSNAYLVTVHEDELVIRATDTNEALFWDGYVGWNAISLDHPDDQYGFFVAGGDLFAQARTGDGNYCWGGAYHYFLYRYNNGVWDYAGWSNSQPVSGWVDWQDQAWITWGGGRNLAYWDQSNWVNVIGSPEPPGLPTSGSTSQVFAYDDKLLVEIGESLIEYNGAAFTPFVDMTNGTPNVVIHDGVDGWFGGDFETMNGLTAHGFALRSGGSWSAPSVSGTGLDSPTIAVGGYQDEAVLATSTPHWQWGIDAIFTASVDIQDALAQDVSSESCHADNLGTCQTYWGIKCVERESRVREFFEFGGELFAVGGIADIDGVEVDGVAKWDGAIWSSIDHDQQDPSANLIVPEQLFALRDIGGVLWMCGYDDEPVVQQFDGSRFNDVPALRAALTGLGTGCDYMRRYSATFYSEGPYIVYGGPTVFDLVEFDGEVVLGTDEGLVSWDGATLDQLDTGWMDTAPGVCCVPHDGAEIVCPKVSALAVDDGVLYAAGWFGLEEDAIRNIVRYEGGQWLPLGDGLNGEVNALVARNGYLIAGGSFTHAGTIEVNGLALWDGTQWSAVDGGVADEFGTMTGDVDQGFSAYVTDLWLSNCGDLYVGGDFFEAGGVTTSHLAIWSAPSLLTGPDCSIVDAPPAPGSLRLAARPNPFNPATEISFDLPRDGDIELVVFDLAGRRVRTLESGRWRAGAHTSEWRGTDDDGQRVSSGVYVVRLTAGTSSESIRVVMVK